MRKKMFGANDNRTLALPLLVVAGLWWHCWPTSVAAARNMPQPVAAKASSAPPLPPAFPGQTGNNYNECMQFGGTALEHGSYQAAADNYREAIKYKPNEPFPHYGLGQALKGMGHEDDALEELFAALTLKPDYKDVRFAIGTIMMKRQSWDEAAGQYMQILKADPKDLGSRGNLGICYEAKGQIDSAIEQFKYIAQALPTSAEPHYNMAAAYDLKGEFDSAVTEYKAAIKLDPRHPLAYFGLANCLMNKRDFKSAILVDEAALKIYPDNYYVYIGLGRAYECIGKDDEALKYYRKAIAINPKAPETQRLMHNMLKTKANKLGLSGLPGLN